MDSNSPLKGSDFQLLVGYKAFFCEANIRGTTEDNNERSGRNSAQSAQVTERHLERLIDDVTAHERLLPTSDSLMTEWFAVRLETCLPPRRQVSLDTNEPHLKSISPCGRTPAAFRYARYEVPPSGRSQKAPTGASSLTGYTSVKY